MKNGRKFLLQRGRVGGAIALVLAICGLGLVAFGGPASATLHVLIPDASTPATFFGHGGYSTDGLGQNAETGGTVQAQVPAGSSVVRAYLYGTYFGAPDGGPDLANRTIDFDGTAVELQTLPNSEPGGASLYTARGEVTTQVAAKVGTGGGITDFAVNSDPELLDGVALVVIYSNPASPEVTIAVLDGGSKQAGDTVTYRFAAPVDPRAPGFVAQLSLGSGFSYQGVDGHACGGGQYSEVRVNADLLTACAGNYDDGVGNDGALITVGGVGDSTENPAQNAGEDDELYNLVPLMHAGDTSLTIDTANPSGDDNLFLAVIAVSAEGTVTTEVCDNGVDDDGDGLTDAADPDCQHTPAACLNYPNFSSTVGLNLGGNAATAGDVLRLTPARDGQSGTAWAAAQVNVGAGFSSDFDFQFTEQGGSGAADGITFAIQSSSATAAGTGGGALGYEGIDHSLVVEFDTYDNGPFYGDPDNNHIAVHTNGVGPNAPRETTLRGSAVDSAGIRSWRTVLSTTRE